MVSYKFTKQRKKIYQLHAGGKDLFEIAKVIGISKTRVSQILDRIKEKVPKSELDKIHASFQR
jgi:DNA-directed RNA polymerase specialized sigma subunit